MTIKIIFLEGPNYCGKSTIIKLLTNFLKGKDKAVYTTREPGGDLFGEEIRRILLDSGLHKECKMDYTCKRLLYAASHTQMLSGLKEIINKYDYIIIDRYNPVSDLIYGPMSFKTMKDREFFRAKSESIFNIFDNDFMKKSAAVIFLDINERVLKSREIERNTSENKIYDFESFGFKKDILYRYKELSEMTCSNANGVTNDKYKLFLPFDHVLRVDANGNEEDIMDEIVNVLSL